MKIPKPNVFIVGVPKAAKVSMNYWLSQHPDIYINPFDTDFFSVDVEGNQRDRVNSEEKYLSYFKNGKGKKIIMDMVTRSAVSRIAAKLIKKFNPNAKIIISIRNPAEQMFSWHWTLRKIGYETEPDFKKALKLEEERKRKTNQGLIKNYFYREFADYYPQVKRYTDIFGKKNVKVVLFDDLGERGNELKKKKTYYDLLKFLGIKKYKADLSSKGSGRSKLEPKNQLYVYFLNFMLTLPKPLRLAVKSIIPAKLVKKIKNITWKEVKEKKKIDPELKYSINKSFEKNLQKLERLINRDLSMWYTQIKK